MPRPSFDPVDPKQSFPALEEGILRYWKEEDLFRRSVRHRGGTSGDPLDPRLGAEDRRFSFYDGPPFATGLPHYGHLLAGTIKDVIPRYQTMRGKYVERRFGWDCHGLPIENLVEKEEGLTSKRDIDAKGVAWFNAKCRASVQRYANEWRTTVERMGRWVDMDWDYRTMDPEYMESIWWVFSQLHDKGLIYEGHKPMHVCPRCVTPLSNFEVTQGYKDVTDASATAKFELIDEPGTFVLAWTTTPWTLPGNLFLAVHPDVAYAKVVCDGATYLLAADLVATVFKDREHTVQGKPMTGKTLAGKAYKPLFPYFVERYPKAFHIVTGDFVTTEDGTGVVHIAPGFGEDDFQVGKREKAELLQHITMDGRFVDAVSDFAGQEVKPADDPAKTDRAIAQWLEKRGLLFSTQSYKHPYPHCWRCDSPLLNYATSSWFVAVEKMRERLLDANAKTAWVPDHVRDGRFGKWLENARDWAISRNRYWGTPLPIWRTPDGVEVVQSRDDLRAKCPLRITKLTAVRHGESEGNVTSVYQGTPPGTPLTKRGQTQAEATGAWLKDQGVTVIYCSPLLRTRMTAERIAAATGAEIIIDDRLRETGFGPYEGKSIDTSDLALLRERRAKKLASNQPESVFHLPGMESWADVSARMGAFLRETLPRHRGDHVVVVTHADPLQTVRQFFTGEDPFKLSHQPYPTYAEPFSFFWDHGTEASLDLHKETVDDLRWASGSKADATDVTLVRHGETDWNSKGLIQGSNENPPLNDAGRAQIRALAATLKKQGFDGILCSDLLRASESAAILAEELGIPVLDTWKSLRERDAGTWSGTSRDEVFAAFPAAFPTQKISLHHASPPEGEALNIFIKRMEEAYEAVLERFPGKRLLIVAHRGTVGGLLAIAEGSSLREVSAHELANAEAVETRFTKCTQRIPDVLDCWFESGSMPYAQPHFPFRNGDHERSAPVGFPADFIAEGLDQTRGWFYTLMVLSTALYDRPPFRNCIVNGIVLAEDGKKMSKRLKNYPDPTAVIDRYGADALRFALMSSPAVKAEDLRFSERVVTETVRSVLLPLWNAYGFFVTYANEASWTPTVNRRSSAHPLDVWLRSEVQDLVNRMTSQLDAYDLSATCAELHDTIDALTNWYIRLSRRRFAGKGALDEHADAAVNEEERTDALATLYDALLTIAQLLAPFCPFATEAMFLNLVAEDHGSIHLTDWPALRSLSAAEQELLARQRLLRSIVSCGLQLRSAKKVKQRQPLSHLRVAISPGLLQSALTDADVRLVSQELNVKHVDILRDPGELGERILLVDARKVGPRVGSRVQELIAAGKRGDFSQDDQGYLVLDERLGFDDANILYRGRDGEDVATAPGIVVGLDVRITPELEREGLLREVIRAVQRLRKEQGCSLGDVITLSVDGIDFNDGELAVLAQETRARIGDNAGEPVSLDLDGVTPVIRFTVA